MCELEIKQYRTNNATLLESKQQLEAKVALTVFVDSVLSDVNIDRRVAAASSKTLWYRSYADC